MQTYRLGQLLKTYKFLDLKSPIFSLFKKTNTPVVQGLVYLNILMLWESQSHASSLFKFHT